MAFEPFLSFACVKEAEQAFGLLVINKSHLKSACHIPFPLFTPLCDSIALIVQRDFCQQAMNSFNSLVLE
jgi:hypothetical protein